MLGMRKFEEINHQSRQTKLNAYNLQESMNIGMKSKKGVVE